MPGIYGPGRLPLDRLKRREPVVCPEDAGISSAERAGRARRFLGVIMRDRKAQFGAPYMREAAAVFAAEAGSIVGPIRSSSSDAFGNSMITPIEPVIDPGSA